MTLSYQAALEKYPPLSSEQTLRLLRHAKKNLQARETLVLHYLRLVAKNVGAFRSHFHRVPQEDIFQAGVEGLLKSIDYFRERKHVKFITYAQTCIYRAMSRVIARHALIHIPAQTYKKHREDFTQWSVVPLPELPSLTQEQIHIEPWLSHLTFQEKQVVKAYYGLDGSPLSLAQIAQQINRSYDWVKKIHRQAIRSLTRLTKVHRLE